MKVFRGFHHPGVAPACALTIGNFDGVHRGHQAMLALLNNEAAHRGVPSCVMTFEPHPRDYFAGALKKPELAPARIATLRDKLTELERCGVQQVVVLPFDGRLASQSPDAFINDVLLRGLGVRYVLVGDDFRFGAKRAGDYAMLDAAGQALGFDVARMNSYEVHGLRVSSSAVRATHWAPAGWLMPRGCWGARTASAAMWCTAASWAAISAPAPNRRATAFAR
jgi:riboflavin kinase/FMN adenylyltransferase